MTNENREVLQQEWFTLHNNTEHSEALALIIKLAAVSICLVGIMNTQYSLLITLLLMVLWLQEAIWKTFQGRTEQRLLIIEKAWADDEQNSTLCFYSSWEKSQPGIAALIAEYLSNAARPTVAYPYLVLVLIALGTGVL